MGLMNAITRRGAVKTALSAFAGISVFTPKSASAAIAPKKPGETLVVYLGGDQLHNGMGQRQSLRGVFTKAGWRFVSLTDARYLTPELIAQADLLGIARWGGSIEGWCPDPIQEGAMSGDGYMSDELENAIVENVQNRGMAFMALHCTAWTPDRPKFNAMMGIEGIMHGPVQTVLFYNINQDHPVTKGVGEFSIQNDENFGVKLTSPKAVTLFKSVGATDKRHDIAGWANESGKGRIVGLVAGHNHEAWRNTTYQELYWRGAHWALKRDIPAFEG